MPSVQLDLFNKIKKDKKPPYFKITRNDYQKFVNIKWKSFEGSRDACEKAANLEYIFQR